MGLKNHAVDDGGTARGYALLNYNYLVFPVTLFLFFTGKYSTFLQTEGLKIFLYQAPCFLT